MVLPGFLVVISPPDNPKNTVLCINQTNLCLSTTFLMPFHS